jgi:predicted transcriptional regulator
MSELYKADLKKLQDLVDESGMNPSVIAREAGIASNTVKKALKNKKNGIQRDKASRIINALNKVLDTKHKIDDIFYIFN